MAAQDIDSSELLEQRRQQLENEIAESDRLLKYWRYCETEYELFKEEIETTHSSADENELRNAVKNFRSAAVTPQEINKLLKNDKGDCRTQVQILDVLRHRLDYVRGNVDTFVKRRDKADEKLRAVDILLRPDMVDEDGLPLTEITEELDDEDNFISGTTRNTADDAGEVIEKIEAHTSKPETKTQAPQTSSTQPQHKTSKTDDEPDVEDPTKGKKGAPHPAESFPFSQAEWAEAKAHARAQELASSLEDEDDGADGTPETQLTRLLGSIAEVDDSNSDGLGPTLKMKDASEFKFVPRQASTSNYNGAEPVIPTEESAEDAALRREMLDYSLNEVGAVVAEMNLDQDGNEVFDDDDNDDGDGDEHDDEEGDEEDDEDEDEQGRSRRPMVSEEYRQQMLQLEKQLNAKALQNIGPAPGRISPPTSDEESDSPTATENVQRPISVVQPKQSAEKKSGKPKGVHFAEDVDIVRDKPTVPKAASSVPRKETKGALQASTAPASNPLADEIQERQPRITISAPPVSAKDKVSRFKAAKTAESESPAQPGRAKFPKSKTLAEQPIQMLQPLAEERAQRFAGPLLAMTAERPRYTPEGPAGKTLDDVQEHHPSEIPEVDMDDDAGLTRQALAAQYYKERNSKIYQQGGFQAEDSAIVPVDENGEETRPRMSRFKAARLGKTNP